MFYDEVLVHDDIWEFINWRPEDVKKILLYWFSAQTYFGSSGPLGDIEPVQSYKKFDINVWRFKYCSRELENWRFLACVFNRKVYFFYLFYRASYDYQTEGDEFNEIQRRYLEIREGKEDEYRKVS